VPADVPLEEPSRGVTGALAPEAWKRLRGWETLLCLAIAASVIHTLLYGTPTPWHAVAVACLLAIPVAYLLVGRRAILGRDFRLGTWYVAILVILYAPVTLVMSPGSTFATFALFGVCPQIFLAVPVQRAVVATVVLVIPEAVYLWLTKPDTDVFDLLVLLTTIVFFASAFGIWSERIVTQSTERAELIRQLEASHAEVARLSAERGALAERERLAGEIHDTLAQGFTSIIMLLQAAEAQPDPSRHLALAIQTAKENLAESRALVAALSPAPLDGSTLSEALRRITGRIGEELGLATAFETRGEGCALPPQYEVVLIRAAQEGLNNVRKHATATRVEVVLEYGPAEVTLRVRDDGRGFGGRDPFSAAGVGEPAAGYGLRAMRSRVEQAGGTLSVGDAETGGAELVVRLPLPPRPQAAAPAAWPPLAAEPHVPSADSPHGKAG